MSPHFFATVFALTFAFSTFGIDPFREDSCQGEPIDEAGLLQILKNGKGPSWERKLAIHERVKNVYSAEVSSEWKHPKTALLRYQTAESNDPSFRVFVRGGGKLTVMLAANRPIVKLTLDGEHMHFHHRSGYVIAPRLSFEGSDGNLAAVNFTVASNVKWSSAMSGDTKKEQYDLRTYAGNVAIFSGKMTTTCLRLKTGFEKDYIDENGNNLTSYGEIVIFSNFVDPPALDTPGEPEE